MTDITSFVLAGIDGSEAFGNVSSDSLRVMYEAGRGNLLAARLFTEVGGASHGPPGLRLSLPFDLDKETLEAVRDVMQEHTAHCSADEGVSTQLQVRVPHGVQVLPFLSALDFLQVPIGESLHFETIAVKWQYEVCCRLEVVAKELVTSFVGPALLSGMDFHHSKHTIVVFETAPRNLRPHDGYTLERHPALVQCPKLAEHVNIAVFASVREKRMKSKGVKLYRMYESPDNWNDGHASVQLEKVLVEQETEWENDFDAKIAELFVGGVQRSVLRNAITSSPVFKGLEVEVLEGLAAVLLTPPWC